MELFTDPELVEIQRFNLDGYLSTLETLLQTDPSSIVSLRLISLIWRALRDFQVPAPSSNLAVIVLTSLTLGATLVPLGYLVYKKMLLAMSRLPIPDEVPLQEVKVEARFEDADEPKVEDLEVKLEELGLGLGRGRGRV